MTYQAFRGEWLKIAGNRWATSFLIWIFPAGVLLFMIGANLFALFSSEFQEAQTAVGINPWNQTLIESWTLPNTELGRWIILAFTAFVFAGEYAHGTWKNIITRRSRVAIILNKFLTLGVFVVVSLLVYSLIYGVGTGLMAATLGIDYGLSNTGAVIGDFLGDYLLQMFITFTITLIAASYTALAAMITRNVMASVIVGVLVTVGESAVLLPIALARALLDIDLMFLYEITPSYNLANISSWIQNDGPYNIMPDTMTPNSLEESILYVVVWVVFFIGLTVYLFKRQDVTT